MKIEEQFPQLSRRVCSVSEFAKAIDTGENRVREYVRAGKIRSVRYGRRIVILIDEIDRFLKDQAGQAA
jgi:excisionase family DNA binding protein